MPNVQIYINNRLMDLAGDEEISVDYAIFDITKVGQRGGARSYEFNLPKTNNNKSVLENPEIINNLSRIPYDRLSCLVLVDGVDVLIRFAEIARAKESYSVRVYGSNSDFFNIISNYKLFDIDYSDIDELWNITTMVAARTRTEGLIYPIVDYNEDSPNAYMNNDNKDVRVETLLPCIFVNDLLARIFDYVGYDLVNEIEDDFELIMPLYNNASNDVVNAFMETKYEGVFHMGSRQRVNYAQVGQFYAFDTVTGNTGTYYNLPYTRPNGTRCLTFVDDFAGTLRFSIDVTFLETNYSLPNYNTINIQILFYDQNDNRLFVTPLSRLFSENPAGFNTFTFDIPFFLQFRSEYRMQVQFLNGDFAGQQHFFIESTSTIEVLDVRFVGNVLRYGEFLNVALLMPDITFLDFIKNYMLMFGILPVINEATKTVTFAKYNVLARNISKAYNWTNKIDLSEEHEVTYVIDKYGQRNYFKYKQDGQEIVPIGSDGLLTIENKNLEFEKDVIELDFASSNYVTRLEDNIVTQIPVYANGEIRSGLSPRILYLKRLASADLGGDVVYSTDQARSRFADNIPMGYFINPEQPDNLGFGNNLLANYYADIYAIISNVKVVSIFVRLSASDISQLDFTRPVFIQQFESYFYISSVKGFSYTDTKSTLVELVKLNIYG